jgi:GH15 family glucan-1,4-alpha-glucosidase
MTIVDLADRWQKVADEIHADICEHGIDDRGVFVQHYDTRALDASLLLMPLVDFLPMDDARIRATVLAIADELTEHGMVLRYRSMTRMTAFRVTRAPSRSARSG